MRRRRGGEQGDDAADLLGKILRPRPCRRDGRRDTCLSLVVALEFALRVRGGARRVLELGPEPADEAAFLFSRAFGIERDEPFEQPLIQLPHRVISRRRRRRVAVDDLHQRREVVDVAEFFSTGSAGVAAGAEVPLEVADPEDELGDGGGARVELDAEELVRIDGGLPVSSEQLLVAELLARVEHFAFEALHVFEGDVEEIAGAAGGVEDADFAELVVERREAWPALRRCPSSCPSRRAWRRRSRTSSHSARSGSMTVGRTSRST